MVYSLLSLLREMGGGSPLSLPFCPLIDALGARSCQSLIVTHVDCVPAVQKAVI